MSAGRVTSQRIVEVLEFLTDGQWHLPTEIKKEMKLTNCQVKKIIDFLKDYNFVTVDVNGRKIKISEEARDFLFQKPTQ